MSLIKIVPRKEVNIRDDIPQTWEELFTRNKNTLEKIFNKIEPIKIPLPVDVFEAYHITPLPFVRVVIIGEDPYPTTDNLTKLPHAKGLSFSYSRKQGFSRSMENVKKELERTYPGIVLSHSCLTSWAYQGVLLLNTSLTFSSKEEKSANIALWKDFIDETIKEILSVNPECIFVAWGLKAKTLLAKFQIKNLLTSVHPSPRNFTGGFVGNNHFKRINEILVAKGEYPIDWNLRIVGTPKKR